MNIILLNATEISSDGRVTLDDHRARHIIQILKPQQGQALKVGLMNGALGKGLIEKLTEASVTLKCSCTQPPPPPPSVDLLLALPRPKILKRLLPQLAALGVGRILLTNAHRVERFYFDTHVLEPAHYTPLLLEGLSQAKDTHLPTITIHKQFKIFLEDKVDKLFPNSTRIVLDLDGGQHLMEAELAEHTSRILLSIGPEGGWKGFEVDLLKQHGFQNAHLSDRTLTTESACIAGLAMAHRMLTTL